jgi:RNA-directed DNA polymerase
MWVEVYWLSWVGKWTEDWFSAHGLYRLRGTIRYPKAA